MKRTLCVLLAVFMTALLFTLPASAEGEVSEPVPEFRLASMSFEDGTVYTFSYENGGYLPTVVTLDGGNIRVSNEYDDAGRLVHYLDSIYDYEDTYSYGPGGEMLEENNKELNESSGMERDTHTVRTYDDSGNLQHEEYTTEVLENGAVSSSVSRVDDLGYEEGMLASRNTTNISSFGESTTAYTYFYDDSGKLVREERSRGTDEGGEISVTEYTYDNSGLLLTEVTRTGEEIRSTRTYEYDDRGRLVSDIYNYPSGAEAHTYEYDEEDRLTCDVMDFNGSLTETRHFYSAELFYVTVTSSGDGSAGNGYSIEVLLNDSQGNRVFDYGLGGFSVDIPDFTYDENGYITSLHYTADGYEHVIDITYEAVT